MTSRSKRGDRRADDPGRSSHDAGVSNGFFRRVDRRADGRCECPGGTRRARQPRRKRAGAPDRAPITRQWTFNFDAGWGTFGFANSLYNNPKEPGVDEDLSDQWFEGYVKPALSGDYTLASSSEIYGKVSAVGERTYGSVPAEFGADVSSFGPEDLSIGWRSGKSMDDRRERARLRRRARRIRSATGSCCSDGAAEGGSRGGYWTNARKAFEFAAIGRFKPGAHMVETFYLDKDELEENESGSRLWGANYEYASARTTTLGATYMKWFADPEMQPGRDGLNVFNVRAYTAPLPDMPDLSFEFEYASERNGEALESNAWTLQGALRVSDVTWKPTLTYRYAFFQGDNPDTASNEAFDPLFLGFYDWGYWWQGGDRGRVLPVQLQPEVAPRPRARRAERRRRRRADVLQVQPRSTAGDRSRRDRQGRRVRDRRLRGLEGEHELHHQLPGRVRRSGKAVQQSTGRTKNFTYGMVYVGYSF